MWEQLCTGKQAIIEQTVNIELTHISGCEKRKLVGTSDLVAEPLDEGDRSTVAYFQGNRKTEHAV